MLVFAEGNLLGYVLSILFGGLCGLIPLHYAKNSHRKPVGIISVVLCAVTGKFFGLMGALPLAGLLTGIVLILKRLT